MLSGMKINKNELEVKYYSPDVEKKYKKVIDPDGVIFIRVLGLERPEIFQGSYLEKCYFFPKVGTLENFLKILNHMH